MLDQAVCLRALEKVSDGFRRLNGIDDTGPGAGDGRHIGFVEWDWEVGVGLYGYLRHAELSGDTDLMDGLVDWYDRQIAGGLPARQINSTAPMLALTLLADRFERPDWRDLIRDWAGWIHDALPRTEESGYQHVVKEQANDGQLWDDTLFMAALFMARAGRLLSHPEWTADAHYQFLVHARFLADRATGLWFHGWTFHGRHNYARALWARGNAWITIAIPELFRLAPPGNPALGRHLAQIYRSQVDAVIACQRPDGLWTTLLDDPDSPPETSATAGFGYGILAGIREGLIEPEFYDPAERAARAVLEHIDEQGIVRGTSDGTPMGHDLEFYRLIPDVAAPYGQALASLLLIELAGW